MKSSAIARLGLLAAVAITTVSCQSSPASVPSHAPSATTGSAPTSAAAEPEAARPTSVKLPWDDYFAFGHFFARETMLNVMRSAGGQIVLFHPELGAIQIETKQLMPGKKIVSQTFASAGTAEHPYLVGAIQISEPAHDLEPATGIVYLVTIDPKSRRIDQQVELARFPDADNVNTSDLVHWLAGTSGGTVAYTLSLPGKPTETIGYDIAARREIWRHPGRLHSSTMVGDGALIGVDRASYKECGSIIALSIPEGAVVFSEDGRERAGGGSSCTDLTALVYSATGVLGVVIDNIHRSGATHPVTAYDFVHKAPNVIDENATLDEHSNLILVRAVDRNWGHGAIDIRDRSTGQLVFSIDDAKAKAISLDVESLLDQKLWVKTSEEKLVLDANTGATLERGWTSYPTAVVDDWVLYSDGVARRAG